MRIFFFCQSFPNEQGLSSPLKIGLQFPEIGDSVCVTSFKILHFPYLYPFGITGILHPSLLVIMGFQLLFLIINLGMQVAWLLAHSMYFISFVLMTMVQLYNETLLQIWRTLVVALQFIRLCTKVLGALQLMLLLQQTR